MTDTTWTEAHQREALRRTYEIAAELADIANRKNGAPWIASHAFANVFDEQPWRGLLSSAIDTARIDREVALVRERAELVAKPAADGDLVRHVNCQACGADTVVYAGETGLLPDEYIDGRRATHSWLVCKLRQESRAKRNAEHETRIERFARLGVDMRQNEAGEEPPVALSEGVLSSLMSDEGDPPPRPGVCESCEFVYGHGHVEAPCKHQPAPDDASGDSVIWRQIDTSGTLEASLESGRGRTWSSGKAMPRFILWLGPPNGQKTGVDMPGEAARSLANAIGRDLSASDGEPPTATASTLPLSPAEIDAIRARNTARTPGKWCWWTSNSFRRLSSGLDKDGDVAHAFVNPSDGHPDIAVREYDMAFIEGATEWIPRLLATLDAREADLESARSDAAQISVRLGNKLRAVTAERDHLKRRERDADGGQYRNDIIGAIKRLRRERDELADAATHCPRCKAMLFQPAAGQARCRACGWGSAT